MELLTELAMLVAIATDQPDIVDSIARISKPKQGSLSAHQISVFCLRYELEQLRIVMDQMPRQDPVDLHYILLTIAAWKGSYRMTARILKSYGINDDLTVEEVLETYFPAYHVNMKFIALRS